MTDRVRTLTVVLDEDTRTDDAEELANCLRRIRGIASVELGPVKDVNDLIARIEARKQLGDAFFNLLRGFPVDASEP